MGIIDTYVTGRYLRVFLATLGSLIVLYFIVDLMEKLDPIMDHDIPMAEVLRFYAWTIPGAIVQFVFLPCLLSCLVVLGVLQKDNELLAFGASGINLHRVLTPLFLITGIICLATLATNEFVVPRAFSDPRVASTFRQLSRSAGTNAMQFNFSYRSDDGKIFRIQQLDIKHNAMYHILYYETSDTGTLKHRVEASVAMWDPTKRQWTLSNVDEWIFDEYGEPERHLHQDEKVCDIKETPQDFLSRHTLPQEFSTLELKKHIEHLKAKSYNPLRETIDLWDKIFLPFWPIPVMLLGMPLILKTCHKGIAAGLGACVAVTACWLMLSSFAMPALARAALIPPYLASGLPPMIGALIGLVGFMRIQR
jgi:lipopolysaccharide export system permease protein